MFLEPFLLHLLLVLRFAKRNVRFSWIFIEVSAAVGTIYNIYVMLLAQHFPFLFAWHIIFVHSHLDVGPQSNRLRLPFGHVAPFLCLFLTFSIDIFLEQLLLLLRNNPLILSIELFSLFLEDLSADDFMLVYAIRLEFSSAALATSH